MHNNVGGTFHFTSAVQTVNFTQQKLPQVIDRLHNDRNTKLLAITEIKKAGQEQIKHFFFFFYTAQLAIFSTLRTKDIRSFFLQMYFLC